MKITKTREEATRLKALKAKAIEGCDTCPCCGESRDILECIKKGEFEKGIMEYAQEAVTTRSEVRHKNLYVCLTCGAEWESDLY